MAVLNLFEECQELTVAGIKNLKLIAKLENGDPITFPIDIVLKNGEEQTILGTFGTGQTVTIGNQTMQYVEPYIENSTFLEEQTEDRRGTYFTITIHFEFPKLELYTNNQLKDFLFTSNGELAIANAVAIITDNNDNMWCLGYDLPLVVESLSDSTGGSDNLYSMTLIAKTYNRLRNFEAI